MKAKELAAILLENPEAEVSYEDPYYTGGWFSEPFEITYDRSYGYLVPVPHWDYDDE